MLNKRSILCAALLALPLAGCGMFKGALVSVSPSPESSQ